LTFKRRAECPQSVLEKKEQPEEEIIQKKGVVEKRDPSD